MARSEKPLSSCPLHFATTLRSSVVLKQVPTMEQYRCAASSQSLRRCLAGISPGTGASRSGSGERHGLGDTVSTTHGLDSGIGTCEGTVVSLALKERRDPRRLCLAQGVCHILHLVMYNRRSHH